VLILTAADVRQSLAMPEAIEAMKRAFAAFSGGEALVPPRAHLPVHQHSGVTLIMPALVSGAEPGKSADAALAVKVVSVFDNNADRGLARIQAAVLVIDSTTGQPQALLEGATLTAIRTAAASGAATDLLARRDARILAILGAGVQARTHIEAMCAVREISEIRVYSRTRSKVEALIAEFAERQSPLRTPNSALRTSPPRLVAAASAREAIKHADIICATTTASAPVFEDADVAAGTQINAVGSFTPGAREIPAETVLRALVVVDSREAAWAEAGDLIQPVSAGLISRDHIHAELGEIVLGRKTGRSDERQVTLFKSVGLAIQDAVAAQCALDAARRLGLGHEIDW
jgi:ornithine cyclodeaminase